jgi:methyl-accepting chemotaxis protein
MEIDYKEVFKLVHTPIILLAENGGLVFANEKALGDLWKIKAIPSKVEVDYVDYTPTVLLEKIPGWNEATEDASPFSAKADLLDERWNVIATPYNQSFFLLEWNILSQEERKSAGELISVVEIVAATSNQVDMSNSMLDMNLQSNLKKVGELGQSSQDMSSSVGSVAASLEEMKATVRMISNEVDKGAKLSEEANQQNNLTSSTIAKLNEECQKIGEISSFINSIAEQTNLLALNATIEAARAGEAGKGFTVVANEVKELSKQTRQATESIGDSIRTIQDGSNKSVKAVQNATKSIEGLYEVMTGISSSVEEQAATITEISNNAQAVHKDAEDVRQVTEDLSKNAEKAQKSITKIKEASNQLSGNVMSMSGNVKNFFRKIGLI